MTANGAVVPVAVGTGLSVIHIPPTKPSNPYILERLFKKEIQCIPLPNLMSEVDLNVWGDRTSMNFHGISLM